MNPELLVLASSAASIALVHTLLGVDHYLPITAVASTRRWSTQRLVGITILIGMGHVAGSVLLGFIGIGLQTQLASLGLIETMRGEIAAWLLVAFGLVYAAWGFRRALRGQHEKHAMKLQRNNLALLSPFAIMVIFIVGPCEPLIPVLMYPAVTFSTAGMVLVTAVFCLVTILTMIFAVLISHYGIRRFSQLTAVRYGHTACGLTICACGLAILGLGA